MCTPFRALHMVSNVYHITDQSFLPDVVDIVHVNQKQMLLPVAWAVTQPSFHYIRVHRREVIFELFQPTCSLEQKYK